jgi:hypothetical protein
MPTLDPRVDAYIERAAPFARDLLRHWRAAVHMHCPDVVETIKWGFPNFTYRAKILTSMAAFKAHCSIGFWHGEAAVGAAHAKGGAMGDFGKLTSLKDLPSKTEQKTILKRAMQLIEDGVKARPARASAPKPPKPSAPQPTGDSVPNSKPLSCTCTLLRPPSLARYSARSARMNSWSAVS